MKIACAQAIAGLARTTVPETVALAYGLTDLGFGPDHIIPKPFDSRLAVELPIAVAKAAMDSGVATRPIADLKAYRERLTQFVFRSGLTMKPIFERARERPLRVVFADGEEPRVLRAVQVLLEEGLAQPVLIGRPDVVRRALPTSRSRPAARAGGRALQSGERSPLRRLRRALPGADGPARRSRRRRPGRSCARGRR